MKITLTLILSIFIQQISFSQEFEFNIQNKKLDDILIFEKTLKSERVPNSSSFFPNSPEDHISFKRKEKNIPDLIAEYTFYKKDSLISEILYEWDIYNFDESQNNKQPLKLDKALIKKYNALEKNITNQFGKSKEEGDLTELSLIDSNEKDHGLKKSNLWKPNDSIEIEMYIVLSNYYKKKGMVTTNPTHKIRLYIRNTKKKDKSSPKLNEKKLDSLKYISNEFLKTLQSKDLSKSRKYLSDLIKEKVTDEQLNLLIENIDFNRETQLFYSGIQFGINGSIFTTLQFKYSDDNGNPPKEMIKIIFDEKDKVVGIQPIKLQGKKLN